MFGGFYVGRLSSFPFWMQLCVDITCDEMRVKDIQNLQIALEPCNIS